MAGQSLPGRELALLRVDFCHSERNKANRNEVEESLAVTCFPLQNSKGCFDSARHDKRSDRRCFRWLDACLSGICAGFANSNANIDINPNRDTEINTNTIASFATDEN